MSLFEDGRYRWRETYFVLFDARRRPSLRGVTDALSAINKRFELVAPLADERGLVDSLTLIAPDDFAAMDICYTEGEEVLEQEASMAADLRKSAATACSPVSWKQLEKYDGRFDVLHFEKVSADAGGDPNDDDSGDEMLDPGALLAVLAALAKLTGGVAIDPQAGAFLTD